MLKNIRIILVEPGGSANGGSTARAMANMGLSDLVLVNPHCELRDAHAIGFAARGLAVLESARIAGAISEALDGCAFSYATTSKTGLYRRQATMSLPDAAPQIVRQSVHGRVGIAFGPENHGLREADLLQFDGFINIPADPGYPVINLAMSVMLTTYEIRRALARATGDSGAVPGDEPATDERKRVLYAKLFDALEQIGFFDYQQNPDHLRFALRRIFGRAGLSVIECDVLIGMSQQIERAAKWRPPPVPGPNSQ
ncbi:MAG: RNA methyltransferase [Deltaproteobacteria bacterium]|nr:RNA methyltransferase [Deltaproteobacteria bacterium]